MERIGKLSKFVLKCNKYPNWVRGRSMRWGCGQWLHGAWSSRVAFQSICRSVAKWVMLWQVAGKTQVCTIAMDCKVSVKLWLHCAGTGQKLRRGITRQFQLGAPCHCCNSVVDTRIYVFVCFGNAVPKSWIIITTSKWRFLLKISSWQICREAICVFAS